MRFELLNTEANPINRSEISINVNFDKDTTEGRSSVNDFDFHDVDLQLILNWIAQGNIFEAIPMRLYPIVGSQFNIPLLLDVSRANPISQHRITVPVLDRSVDWFERNSNFTLSFLYERINFVHPNFNFIPIPYVVVNESSRVEMAITFIACVSVVMEAFNMLQQLIQIITKANAMSWAEWFGMVPFFIYALAVSLSVIQTLFMVYNLLIQPVKFHFGMSYKDILTVGFAYLGLEFKSSIFIDDPKWSRLVYLPEKREDFEDSNNNLLMDFLNIDLTVLKGRSSSTYGEEKGYPEKTFKELVDEAKLLINGKLIFESEEIIRLERKDYLEQFQSGYQLPPLDNDNFTYNATDLWSSFYLTFETDLQDAHTIDNYNGNAFTEIVTPVGITDKKNLTLANRVEVRLPMARGTRKQRLTKIELIVKKAFDKTESILRAFEFQHNFKMRQLRDISTVFFDAVSLLLPSSLELLVPDPVDLFPPIEIPDYAQLINGRIGMLQLSSESIEVPKLLLMDINYTLQNASTLTPQEILQGSYWHPLFNQQRLNDLLNVTPSGTSPRLNLLSENNASVVSAETIFNEFYSIDSPVPNDNGVTNWASNNHGQRVKKSVDKVWFVPSSWLDVKNNAYFTDSENNICKFEGDLSFNPTEQSAGLTYSYKKIYCTNLVSQKIISNGAKRDI